MDNRIITARNLCRQVGNEFKQARTDAGMTMRQVETVTGIAPPFLSLIEHGTRIPTVEQWTALVDLYGLNQPVTQCADSARRSDLAQSHDTVRSIADDHTITDRIVQIARDVYPESFDDTDLVEQFQQRWPRPPGRPWQRNVIAKARLRLHTFVTVRNGQRVRVERDDGPIVRVGNMPRLERGHDRPSTHHRLNRTE